ncbi:hypothetical protein E4T49_07421 [Aureobasidium sp. EXF-10728]|nr:hypothetical protein E4T49_07421 [Aureobasidium sp. EXF-10728]
MKFIVFATLTGLALAARPFLNEPDTGIDEALENIPDGTLPPLESIVGLPDFEWAARHYMNTSAYTYYRNGAAGEWSYRNNLEVFQRYTARPRVLRDNSKIESTFTTSILGHNFSAPFYISPCARGALGNERAELGLVEGAYQGDILYIPSDFSSLPLKELAAARPSNGSQVMWQQVYLDASNDTATKAHFKEIEESGARAIVFTVDSAGPGVRHRAQRYSAGSADADYSAFTWQYYQKLQNFTRLPVVIKGIQTVEDAKMAVKYKAPAIVLSNHGGRNLDGSPSGFEVALEIHQEAPEIFQQIEVYADGGVRYGSDVLKMLALGVRAVGLGRPFMYANVYGTEGVAKAVELLKAEIASDAAHLGLSSIKDIGPQYFKWTPNNWKKDGGVHSDGSGYAAYTPSGRYELAFTVPREAPAFGLAVGISLLVPIHWRLPAIALDSTGCSHAQGDKMASSTTAPSTASPVTSKLKCMDDLINMNVSDMTAEQRARFEIKREHEFYSYYEPIRALATREMDWTDLNSDESVAKHRPVQSSDKALTAFCQLAAIRLKMRRAMIFFFDTTHAYILAEATRTLSLHDDSLFDDDQDALWLGTTKIPRGFSVCEHTVNLPSNAGTNAHDDDSHLIHIINNLTQDTRFCNRPYVTGGPRARFYAGVPITTPKGLKIGAFCVLDDKPHQGLAKKEIDFMQEMSVAVMSHLDMIKAKVEQRRGTDMVTALGAFTASESSARRDTKTDDDRPQLRHDISASSSLLTIGNLDPSPPAKRPTLRRQSSSSKYQHSSSATDRITNIRETSPRRQRPSWFAKNRARSDMSVYTESAVDQDSVPLDCLAEEPKVHSAEQSPNHVMQSASDLIRKAVDADGVLFLDAAVTGFGNLVSNSFLDKTPDNDLDATTSGTDGHQTSEGEEATPHAFDADNQPCPILGASYATRTGAVPDPETRRDIYSQLTPKFLRSVLRRFKGAKVWNFNENGEDYLDDHISESQSASDGGASTTRSSSKTNETSSTRKSRQRSFKHAPGKQLAAAFPGVRSLMVLGLWDPQRNQWRAGCVIWSCTPMRMFSNEGEMHYLTAFCDVIMAKLARLDVDVANNIKSDFISSISHELRSPLHGILGSVEVLQEQNIDHETAEMVSQIDTCGRTLLDIVDHLLEFSRINVLTKHTGSKMRSNLKDLSATSADKKSSDNEASSLDADIALDVVTEEVVESAVYSFCCSRDQRTLSERNVTVSMDIERHPSISWDCKVTVGAWKRVCVNLVNNALKYTTEGSINVSLKILPPQNKLGRPVAQLSVIDTGRGMSKDFLRTKLFRAFSQEDDLAEGTGLGMSMVARIVKAHVLGSPEMYDRSAVATGRYQQLVTFSKMCSSMGMDTSGPTWQFSDKTDFAVIAEMVPAQEQPAAEDIKSEGLGVEKPTQLPEVADGALTAASLAELDPQASQTRHQSIVSMPSMEPSPKASKPCLLLVDDNPINLQLLVTYAKKNGHAMHKASDGSQAVEAYKNAHTEATITTDKPEVVLMDISMPVMDGFEASRQIRAFERQKGLKPVVIIALTGLGSSEAQHEAFVSGINLFLTKPVRLKELTKLLGTIKDTFG